MLIYRVGQLGDSLIALPAIQAIARKHPDCRIVLLTDRHIGAHGYVSSWDVLGPTGLIDEVVFYEPRGRTTLGRLRQMLTSLLRLRSYHFTNAYNLARRTTERAIKRDQFFFNYLVGVQRYTMTAALRFPLPGELAGVRAAMEPEWRRLLRSVGADSPGPVPILKVPDAARAEAEAAWPNRDDGRTQIAIALAPGSKMNSKRWSEARFAELGRRLLREISDLRIVIIGGAEDAALGDRLCTGWGKGGLNLAGKLSIYGSAAAMERCALYVGNDTGSMHLAAMVGSPCVAIFSARDYPGLWEPFGTGHVILRKDIACAGCMLENCIDRGSACLELIPVDEVFDAALSRLRISAVPSN